MYDNWKFSSPFLRRSGGGGWEETLILTPVGAHLSPSCSLTSSIRTHWLAAHVVLLHSYIAT